MTQTAQRPRTALINLEEVRRAYSLLVDKDQVIELRLLEATLRGERYKQTLGGFFDNVDDLIQALSTIQSALGQYITIQQLDPDLLHRAKNKIIPLKKDYSTPDKNVKRYQWLPLDCDIVREVKLISSNDEEHSRALSHAQQVKQMLSELGWPEPFEADSGNGAHLLYRIDLPNTEENADLIARVLTGIAARTNTEAITLDETVYNPARIWKLYGTLACKGDNTQERPHRMAHLLAVPDTAPIVTREMLEQIATPKEVPQVQYAITRYVPEPTLEEWLRAHNIRYHAVNRHGVDYFILDDGCVFNPEHQGDDAAVFVAPSGRWSYHCFHESCGEKHWQDFRQRIEPDAYTRNLTPVSKQEPDSPDDSQEDQGKKKEPTAVVKLMAICDLAKFIKTPTGELYARVPVRKHYEVLSISAYGSGFRRWLVWRYKQLYGTAPNSDALSLVMEGVKADAEFMGEVAKVHIRKATKNGCVYLDMCDDEWRCIEISPTGWKIINQPPVYFRRTAGMLPLPDPAKGGSIQDLRSIINASTDEDYMLITAWLLGVLHPNGPYPTLNLNGMRGSAKSTNTARLRNIFDPNEAPHRSTPKDEVEAAITAENNMVVAYDNLSKIPLWFSDVICKLSTGHGISKRQLYTDKDEIVIKNRRPVIFNGIEDGIVKQEDLQSRTIQVMLQPPSQYMTEEMLEDIFAQKHPYILGAFLDAAVIALRDRKTTTIPDPPRMADFATWVVAAESTLGWQQGIFLDVYKRNLEKASSIVTESSPVAKAILQFMEKWEKWEGMASDLLMELVRYEVLSKSSYCPTQPSQLSNQIGRLMASLYVQGVKVVKHPRTKQGSKFTLERLPSFTEKNSSGVSESTKFDELITTQTTPKREQKEERADNYPPTTSPTPDTRSDGLRTGTSKGVGDLEGPTPPIDVVTSLRSQIEDLYNGRIAPLLGRKKSDEDILWRGGETGFPQSLAIPSQYTQMVEACRDSNDPTRMRACLEAMNYTLTGMSPYDRRSQE